MPILGRKRYRCRYPECNNCYYSQIESDHVNKHFYKFPSNNYIRKFWLAACNIDNLPNSRWYVVCEDHFKSRDFRENSKKLKCYAVPISFPSTLCKVTISKHLIAENEAVNSTNSSVICTCFDPSSSNSICLGLPTLSFLQKLNLPSTVLEEHNYCSVTNKIIIEPQLKADLSKIENCKVTNYEPQLTDHLSPLEICKVISNEPQANEDLSHLDITVVPRNETQPNDNLFPSENYQVRNNEEQLNDHLLYSQKWQERNNFDNRLEHNYFLPPKGNLDKQKISVNFLIDKDGIISKVKFTNPFASEKSVVFKIDKITFSKLKSQK